MPETKKDYQKLTACVHLALTTAALIACAPAFWGVQTYWWVSLILTAITNAIVAWAKWDLLKAGKS